MKIVNNKQPLILFLGDFFVLFLAIWATLLLRNLQLPSAEQYMTLAEPFSILFIFWVIVIYIAGLYDRLNSVMWRQLPQVLIKTQVVNIVLAVVFFYFVPMFAITPKTILFIYLVVSLALLSLWRILIYPKIVSAEKQKSFLIARGQEMQELRDEINNGRYGYYFVDYINLEKSEHLDPQSDIVQKVYSEDAKTVVIDTQDDTVIPLLSHLYNLMFSRINFVDMHEVYEHVFGRIPLSLVKHGWFLKNVTTEAYEIYDGIKRIFDIVIATILFLISLLLYPFIILAIKTDGRGKIFFTQERIGQDNKKIRIYKFRTMSEEENTSDRMVTKVGRFLRVSRLDEIPQLVNVIKGDLSLVGPRPETSELVSVYSDQIPYYNVRHLIKPGLSGWAQVYHQQHPHHTVDIDETKNKLSYDLFYIKNRSLFLDLKIGLQTLRTLVLRKGK
jgi:exopolysaccharide biosynthesis polyprenyl glycosylphosphotransferase